MFKSGDIHDATHALDLLLKPEVCASVLRVIEFPKRFCLMRLSPFRLHQKSPSASDKIPGHP
jgi:hypothetical protein